MSTQHRIHLSLPAPSSPPVPSNQEDRLARDHLLEQEYGRTFAIWEGPIKYGTKGGETGGVGVGRSVDDSRKGAQDKGDDRSKMRFATEKEMAEVSLGPPGGTKLSGSAQDRRSVAPNRPAHRSSLHHPASPNSASTKPTSTLPPLSHFIDLTISSPPKPRPGDDVARLSRPRAVPRYTSPEARTAMTPPRKDRVKVRSKGGVQDGLGLGGEAERSDRGGAMFGQKLEGIEARTGSKGKHRARGIQSDRSNLHPFFRSAPQGGTSNRSTQSTQSTQSSGTGTSGSSALTPPPPPSASQPRMSNYFASPSISPSSSSGQSDRAGPSERLEYHSSIESGSSGRMTFQSCLEWSPVEMTPEEESEGHYAGTRPGFINRGSLSGSSRRVASSSILASRGPSPYSPPSSQSRFPRESQAADLHTSVLASEHGDKVQSSKTGTTNVNMKREKHVTGGWQALSTSESVREEEPPPMPDEEELEAALSAAPCSRKSKKPGLYPDLTGLEASLDKLTLGMHKSRPQMTENGHRGLRKAVAPDAEPERMAIPAPSGSRPRSPAAMLDRTGSAPIFSYTTYKALHPRTSDATPYKPPHVVYVTSASEANDLIPTLTGNVVGFDLEWPVIMGKSKSKNKVPGKEEWRDWQNSGKVALVQVGTDKMVLLLHIALMGVVPRKLVELCLDKSIHKIGVGIKNDGHKLVRDFNIRCRSLLELTQLARRIDPLGTGPGATLISLKNFTRAYLGYDLPKGDVRQSNWKLALNREQMEYAANDVVSAVLIYQRLMAIAKERNMAFELPTIDLHEELASRDAVMSKVGGDAMDSAKIAPAEIRAFVLFSMGKSGVEISEMMRTVDDPLKLTTVQTYLINAVSKDATLDYDKRRMYTLLSEGNPKRTSVHRALLARLATEMVAQDEPLIVKVEEE